MGLKIVTQPAEEPVSLDEARLHLRVDADGSPGVHPDDARISSFITTARRDSEAETNRAFIETEFLYTLDAFPCRSRFDGADRIAIKLPISPLIEIVEIKYIDADGELQTLAEADYVLDDVGEPTRIMPESEAWPATKCVMNAVRVQFKAGFGAAEDVPEEIKDALLLIVGNLYENRESIITGTSASSLPLTAKDLLYQWKVFPE